jgi:hypothetical protein
VPPTVGVATVSGAFPGFPVHPGGRFAGGGPSGGSPLRRAVSRRPVACGSGARFRYVAANAGRPNFCAGLRHWRVAPWSRDGGTERFPGGPSSDCTHRPRPTGQRAGAVHPGEIALASRHGATRGATICGQRSGTVRQVRPNPAPRHFPRLGAGPPLPRHSSGSSALKPVSSAACRKAGDAPLTRNATPASVTA